jgi:hypothetical protein
MLRNIHTQILFLPRCMPFFTLCMFCVFFFSWCMCFLSFNTCAFVSRNLPTGPLSRTIICSQRHDKSSSYRHKHACKYLGQKILFLRTCTRLDIQARAGALIFITFWDWRTQRVIHNVYIYMHVMNRGFPLWLRQSSQILESICMHTHLYIHIAHALIHSCAQLIHSCAHLCIYTKIQEFTKRVFFSTRVFPSLGTRYVYVCMYVWMHACIYTCVYVCVYSYMYLYMCVHALCVCMCVSLCMHVFKRMYVCMLVCVFICVNVWYVCIYTHYIHMRNVKLISA